MSEPYLLVGIVLYLGVLLSLGALGRKARVEPTLSDHFLAGRGLGVLVLLLTLFATQYSGNSLSGFPGRTYREGAAYFMCVTFMISIVSGYLAFAPKLFRASRKHKFLTPGDYLKHRWNAPWLHTLSTLIFCFVLMNFLLAQLTALGHAVTGTTNGAISFQLAVLVGAAVILFYEWLGGMRAVAWTDVLQGGLLIFGITLLSALLWKETGGLGAVFSDLAAKHPEKVAPPNTQGVATWISNLALLGLGAPLYPQAIQRIFAARSGFALKKALGAMAWIPLIAISTVVFIGLVGILWFPGLERVESDGITFMVLGELTVREPAATIPVLIVTLAVLAAIMSTADSCLLSLTSILTKDVFAKIFKWPSNATERHLHWTPWISLVVMASLTSLALAPRFTLWGLLVLKFEVLIQLSPAFILGARYPKGHQKSFVSRDLAVGLSFGFATFFLLYGLGQKSIHGFHAGSIGVLVNYLFCLIARGLRLSAGSRGQKLENRAMP